MIIIRSQDKTRLLNANYIRANGNCIEAIHSDMLCTLIGTYSTEEKALKVLDMIQYNIERLKFAEMEPEANLNYDVVFQMPSDDEVE